MNFSDIKFYDLVNGEGVGISIFVSGCNLNCPGCFNKKAQNFHHGFPFIDETLEQILKTGADYRIDHLSILGGEPLDPANFEVVNLLACMWKEKYPNKPIWLWTGYSLADIWERTYNIYEYLDYIVDGPYIREQPTTKPFRGSDNQRLLKKVPYSEKANFDLRIVKNCFIIVS